MAVVAAAAKQAEMSHGYPRSARDLLTASQKHQTETAVEKAKDTGASVPKNRFWSVSIQGQRGADTRAWRTPAAHSPKVRSGMTIRKILTVCLRTILMRTGKF